MAMKAWCSVPLALPVAWHAIVSPPGGSIVIERKAKRVTG